MTKPVDLAANTIDMRDIFERFEELESIKDNHGGTFNQSFTPELSAEYANLSAIRDMTKGLGGDEQFRGDWYPLYLIRDSYFTEYAKEMLIDCGDLPRNIPHYIAIDWQATAKNIRVDYEPVIVNGIKYWTR